MRFLSEATLALVLVPYSAIATPQQESSTTEPPVLDLLAGLTARSGGLTANHVAERAVATSFDLASRRQDTSAAHAATSAALIAFFPRLALLASYTRYSAITSPSLGNSVVAPEGYPLGLVASDTPLTNVAMTFPVHVDHYFGQATLTLPISDYLFRLSKRYESATRSERSTDLARRAESLLVAANAKVAYYEWARARLARRVAEQALAQAQLHLQDARALFANEMAADADVLRVESQVALTRQLAGRAASLERAAADQLATLMHVPPAAATFEIGDDLTSTLPDDETSNLDGLVQQAARDRLEPRVLGETAASLDAQASATRWSLLPRLDGVGSVVYANPNPRYIPNRAQFDATWAVGVQLTWVPNELGTSLAEARGAEARAAAARSRRAALADGVRKEVSEGLRAWNDAQLAVATSTQGLVASEQSYRVRRARFLNQRATSVELSDAETDLLRARLDAVNARIDQRIAKVRLAHAVGLDGSDERKRAD